MLLTVHPKATLAKDASGKTPLDHAQFVASTSPTGSPMSVSARQAIVLFEQVAPLLVSVTKSAMNKLAYDSDSKLQQAVESYKVRMNHVKEQYQHDKTEAEALETEWRMQLKAEQTEKNDLNQRVAQLENERKGKDQRIYDRSNSTKGSHSTLTRRIAREGARIDAGQPVVEEYSRTFGECRKVLS